MYIRLGYACELCALKQLITFGEFPGLIPEAFSWLLGLRFLEGGWSRDLIYRGKRTPDCTLPSPESACNAGDPSLIPGLGRSPGEGIGCPLQCSWASLVAQLVNNPPAMWEIWVRSLGWEDPLEKGKATHSSIPAWRIPWRVHGVTKSRT